MPLYNRYITDKSLDNKIVVICVDALYNVVFRSEGNAIFFWVL